MSVNSPASILLKHIKRLNIFEKIIGILIAKKIYKYGIVCGDGLATKVTHRLLTGLEIEYEYKEFGDRNQIAYFYFDDIYVNYLRIMI